MNALQLFVHALEERLNANGKHRGTFVCKQNVETGPFKAYKKYIQEVWNVDGSNKQLIAKAEFSGRIVYEEEKASALDSLYSLTIKEVLKYYGI